jgi:hypothetical protein
VVGKVKNIDRAIANGAFEGPGEIYASWMVDSGIASGHPVCSTVDVGVVIPGDGALNLTLSV